MERHDLGGLASAIQLTSKLLRTLAATAPIEWPHYITEFIARLRAASLQDARGLAVLLADVRAQIAVLASDMGQRTSVAVIDEQILMAMSRDEVLAWFCAEALALASEAAPTITARSRCVASAIWFIEERYAEPVTTNSIASAVGVSKPQLVATFRREMRQTMHAYLTQVRLRRSMELIRAGEKIEAVSLLVGYKSRKNFYRQFKAVVGMTPVAYKTTFRRRHMPHRIGKQATATSKG
jgi:AraC-like DNA-binding protein